MAEQGHAYDGVDVHGAVLEAGVAVDQRPDHGDPRPHHRPLRALARRDRGRERHGRGQGLAGHRHAVRAARGRGAAGEQGAGGRVWSGSCASPAGKCRSRRPSTEARRAGRPGHRVRLPVARRDGGGHQSPLEPVDHAGRQQRVERAPQQGGVGHPLGGGRGDGQRRAAAGPRDGHLVAGRPLRAGAGWVAVHERGHGLFSGCAAGRLRHLRASSAAAPGEMSGAHSRRPAGGGRAGGRGWPTGPPASSRKGGSGSVDRPYPALRHPTPRATERLPR